MTITSMAPLRVAGLIEFQVLETEPLMLLTYCIPRHEGREHDQPGSKEGVRGFDVFTDG